jgi:23S rRNA (uracil1939-C5)-methyltransferase
MGVKKGQILDVDVDNIAFGGRGLVRIDGLAVFIDGAVPGDRARIRVFKKKKNYAEARVMELIQASIQRVDPRCRYSGTCGGCKWQFLNYEKQLEYKRRHVLEAIEHIGLLNNIPVHAAIPSEKIFAYRNKMEFSCSDRRWLLSEELGNKNIDNGFAVGLHVPGCFDKVLDTQECLIQPEQGNLILDDVRQYIRRSNQPVYGLKSHDGFWRFVMLRYSVAFDQWMVNVVTASEDLNSIQPLAERLIDKYPHIVSIMNNITARKAGVAFGEYEICVSGENHIRERIGPLEFKISANSFFQTNTRGAKTLYETVKRQADLDGSQEVVDLYSGTGTIALFLSDSARRVTGLEIVSDAVADAERNCRINGVENCRFIDGDIRESISQIPVRPDVMIIDPPRAGMHKDVVKKVIDMKPPRIVYVSCNPASLARDLGMMKSDFRVHEVQPVDMFPHTYHIEAVARLEAI